MRFTRSAYGTGRVLILSFRHPINFLLSVQPNRLAMFPRVVPDEEDDGDTGTANGGWPKLRAVVAEADVDTWLSDRHVCIE